MTALALWRCGARPLRITPGRPVDESGLNALVIGGGTDVHPSQYGESAGESTPVENDPGSSVLDWTIGLVLSLLRAVFASHSVQSYDPDRDELEKHLIRYALYGNLPILGICRGAQLMNVVLGGTLYRDIGHFYTEDTGNVRSILPRKSVELVEGAALRQILGRVSCRVNALHDQSVRELGEEVRVAAVERTGVIQAIERPRHPFFVGVQWHPEYIPQSRTQQRLFQTLVARAGEPRS
jgi:putative glutamine amidotransferase